MSISPSDELLSQLERVTATRTVDHERPDAELMVDPETVELRTTWLALCGLFEAAQPRAEVRLPEPAFRQTVPVGDRHRWLNMLMVAGSLAAALLLAVTGFYLPRVPTDMNQARNPRSIDPDRRIAEPGKLASEKKQVASDHEVIDVVVAHNTLAWKDDLDDQLLDAWGRVYQLQTTATTLDVRHASVVDSMQKLQQDLAGDSTL